MSKASAERRIQECIDEYHKYKNVHSAIDKSDDGFWDKNSDMMLEQLDGEINEFEKKIHILSNNYGYHYASEGIQRLKSNKDKMISILNYYQEMRLKQKTLKPKLKDKMEEIKARAYRIRDNYNADKGVFDKVYIWFWDW